jgi:hypothetical protein
VKVKLGSTSLDGAVGESWYSQETSVTSTRGPSGVSRRNVATVGDYLKDGAESYSTRIGGFRMPECGGGGA